MLCDCVTSNEHAHAEQRWWPQEMISMRSWAQLTLPWPACQCRISVKEGEKERERKRKAKETDMVSKRKMERERQRETMVGMDGVDRDVDRSSGHVLTLLACARTPFECSAAGRSASKTLAAIYI